MPATETAYFEATAREGERLSESDKAAHFQQWIDQVDDIIFIDLKSPWIFS